jgi:hypothetical protein
MFAVLFTYFGFRIWRLRKNYRPNDTGSDFHPRIGFTRLDGGASLALLLDNHSEGKVWVEEIEIVLTGLVADEQTSHASCHEIQKIRQMVGPQDMLPISLVETIYRAAGHPQRKYSCLMSSMVRYQADGKRFEEPMLPCSLKMAGLTVVSERMERWAVSQFKPDEKSDDLQLAGTKWK